MISIAVRSEEPADFLGIKSVNEAAFGQSVEGDLVDALRRAATPFLSLVAEHDGSVVGHISFSPVTIDGRSASPAFMGLAPMAVLPRLQKQGVGTALVRSGVRACSAHGHQLVFVVGHAEYYPRFGFVPAKARGLTCEYDVPEEVFMVVELVPGALSGRHGVVRYHEAFGLV